VAADTAQVIEGSAGQGLYAHPIGLSRRDLCAWAHFAPRQRGRSFERERTPTSLVLVLPGPTEESAIHIRL